MGQIQTLVWSTLLGDAKKIRFAHFFDGNFFPERSTLHGRPVSVTPTKFASQIFLGANTCFLLVRPCSVAAAETSPKPPGKRKPPESKKRWKKAPGKKKLGESFECTTQTARRHLAVGLLLLSREIRWQLTPQKTYLGGSRLTEPPQSSGGLPPPQTPLWFCGKKICALSCPKFIEFFFLVQSTLVRSEKFSVVLVLLASVRSNKSFTATSFKMSEKHFRNMH